MKRKKILLIYPTWSVFVQTDYEILSGAYDVEIYHFRPAKGALGVSAELARQFVFILFNFWKFDAFFIWFADQHSLLPILFARLTGRKSYLVAGGYDVCRIPSLKYGVFCSKPRGFAASWSMRNSTLNLPVSANVARKVRAIAPRHPFKTVYNCVKLDPGPDTGDKSGKFVLTVAFVDSERTYYIKGIDLFVEAARRLPGIPFLVAGFQAEKLSHLSKDFPPNLTVYPPLRHEELTPLFHQSAVYCQLSRSEAFGIALAEAILHGCIPVVANEGGMPEIAGDKRYIVSKNPDEIATRILNFIEHDDKKISFAIQNIKENFSVGNRRKALFEILES